MSKPLNFFSGNERINNARHCAACNYSCCITDENNFIVLFPWELDAAKQAGLSTEHLKPIKGNLENVHCARPCTNKNDYKPINCATYPLYPITEDLSVWVRGAKNRCPISDIVLSKQINIVANGLQKIEQAHPSSIKTMVDFIHSYPGALEIFEYGSNGKKLTPQQIAFANKVICR